jgi:hypothetical protein
MPDDIDSTPVEAPEVVDAPAEESSETGSVTVDEVAAVLGKGKVSKSNVAEPVVAEEETPEEPETPAEPVKPEVKPIVKEAPATTAEPETDAPDFSVTVEDGNGESHKIERIEDLPEDFEPKNNRQIMEILRDLSIKESEKSTYETDQANAKSEADKQERITNIQTGWDEEVKSLQADKRIPVTTDPTKNERVEQIYKFMGEENTRRDARGLPPLVTIEDVLDKLEKQETSEAATKAASEAKETARKNGGLVGGSSAPATGNTPVYKGGAKNAAQALKMMSIL